MNVPLGIIAIALAVWVLPKTRTRSRKALSFDLFGVLLFGLAVLSLMWPFLFTTGSPDDDPRRWWLLVAFVLFAGAFVAWERHYEGQGKQPLIRFALFRISSFRNGTLLIAAYFTALPALFLLTTLFLQTGVGLAPVYAGMVTIGFALASAVFSWIGGNLVGTYGRPVVVWGLVGVLACVIGLAAAALFVPAEWVAWVMAGVMVIGGIGGGLVMSPNQTLTLGRHPGQAGRRRGIDRPARAADRHLRRHGGRAVAVLRDDLPRGRRRSARHRRVPRRLRVRHDGGRDLHRARVPHLGRRPQLAPKEEVAHDLSSAR